MTLIASLLRDFRYSARSLARAPGFTVVAVAVLALGIGATSAIFSLVNAIWLRPLPFPDETRLVSLWADFSQLGRSSNSEVTPSHYVDWRERAQSFDEMALLEPISVDFTGRGEPERLLALRTTANLFVTLDVKPLVGRVFGPDEGVDEPVVLSEGFWLRRLGGDPAAVGRTITLDGTPHVVIGVVPGDFRFPNREQDVFIAHVFPPQILAERRSYSWNIVAKLRRGVSLEAAQTEMRSIATTLEGESPNSGRGVVAAVVPIRDHIARSVTPTLLGLLGSVALVLLVACANVANLTLARGSVRGREFAIRKALGADRPHVLQQLVAESALLAGAGVLVGFVLAGACFDYLRRFLPATVPASTDLALDWRVIALTVCVALVTVLLFGVGPAFATSRRDVGAAIGRVVGPQGKQARRLRTALVIGEIALTVLLLAGAGLLLRSYRAVLATDLGFDSAGLLVAGTVLQRSRYPEPVDRDVFYQQVLERVRALPGVESAGYTNFAPLALKGGRSITVVDGRPFPSPDEIARSMANNRAVSPGYLETLGVRLLRGRSIDTRDTRTAPAVAVVNETMARAHWPDGDPIGQRFRTTATGDTLFSIVGVVADIRQGGLDVLPEPELYVPVDQVVTEFMWPHNLVVRAAGDPLGLSAAVRSAVWEVDPDQPVSDVRTMADILDAEIAGRGTQLTLIGSFSAIALLLSAVGLYGVVSYTTVQRTQEIGLRMALGASPRSVVAAVVGSAMLTALAGTAGGLVMVYALTRTIASFLYGVSPTDPITATVVACVLLVVAALASFVPAYRAARVNPVIALRADA